MNPRFVAILAALGLCACGGGGSSAPAPSVTPPPVNQSPRASAGQGQTVLERETVFIDGSASRDPDGTIATYLWESLSGLSITLIDPDQPMARFQAPEVTQVEPLTLRLTVTDDNGATDSETITIDIAPDPIDEAPIHSLMVDGRERIYRLYKPDTFVAGNPAYMILHGGGQSMVRLLRPDATARRWVEIADRDGILLIVPNGFNATVNSGTTNQQSWNDFRNDMSGRTSSENDVAFLASVLDDVASRETIDRDAIFVAGSSNGGMMTMTLLIEDPWPFKAGAAFIAALPEEAVPMPASPTPFFMLNGTVDPLIRYFGGPVSNGGAPTRSVRASVDYWITATGSDPTDGTVETLPDRVADDGCTLTVEHYPPTAPFQFVYYEAIGGGHAIPDPEPPIFSDATRALIGNQCRERHGIDLAVDFFKALN